MTMDSDPNKVIPLSINGALNALRAAYSEPAVKRFIYTSSSSAAVTSTSGVPAITVTEETWNDEAVKQAWAPPPYGPERSYVNYPASKTQTEREVWKFHKENGHKRPDLVVNASKSRHPASSPPPLGN